jgi:urease accessory protein
MSDALAPGDTGERLALLRLMHLVSPALPVGAYAYSQGLESAVELGWVHDVGGAQDWLAGVMHNGLARLELPVLLRFMRATSDEQWQHWNQWLLAARETDELYREDTQLGAALRKILATLEIAVPPPLQRGDISFVTAFALAGRAFGIAPATLAMGLAWSWLENQVAAATKLIPLGQTQALRILDALIPQLAALPTQALLLDDDEIGATLPGLVMASSFHQTQYSRLFRS